MSFETPSRVVWNFQAISSPFCVRCFGEKVPLADGLGGTDRAARSLDRPSSEQPARNAAAAAADASGRKTRVDPMRIICLSNRKPILGGRRAPGKGDQTAYFERFVWFVSS